MIHWICLFVHPLYVILYIALNFDVASTNLFKPMTAIYFVIEILTGTNYKKWKSDIELAPGLVDQGMGNVGG